MLSTEAVTAFETVSKMAREIKSKSKQSSEWQRERTDYCLHSSKDPSEPAEAVNQRPRASCSTLRKLSAVWQTFTRTRARSAYDKHVTSPPRLASSSATCLFSRLQSAERTWYVPAKGFPWTLPQHLTWLITPFLWERLALFSSFYCRRTAANVTKLDQTARWSVK